MENVILISCLPVQPKPAEIQTIKPKDKKQMGANKSGAENEDSGRLT